MQAGLPGSQCDKSGGLGTRSVVQYKWAKMAATMKTNLKVVITEESWRTHYTFALQSCWFAYHSTRLSVVGVSRGWPMRPLCSPLVPGDKMMNSMS